MKKRFKQILLSFLVFILLLVASGFFVAYFYEKEIKSIIITEINKRLNTEITVKSSSFSLYRTFPFASLMFTDVLVNSTQPKSKDTLLFAKKVFLEFNIMDIYKKNYTIKKIHIKESQLNLRIDKKGGTNYHFIKPEKASDNSSFSFALEKIIFDNCELSFVDEKNNQNITTYVKHLKAKGHFSEEKYNLSINSETYVRQLQLNSINYLHNEKVDVDVSLKIDNATHTYTFRNGEIVINNELHFVINGDIQETTSAVALDLTIDGKDVNIASFVKLLPSPFSAQLNNYSSSGVLDFQSTLKGNVSAKENPTFNVNFGMKDGTLKQNDTHYQLNNIYLQGNFSNETNNSIASSRLRIDTLKATLGEGTIRSKLEIKNFVHPWIKATIIGSMNLSDMQQFIQWDTIANLSGDINFETSFHGQLENFDAIKTTDIKKVTTTGKVELLNAKVQLKDSPLLYENINGVLILNNNDIIVENLKGLVSSTDFELSGLFRNILAYMLLPDEHLIIEADYHSNNINLDELLATDKSSYSDTSYALIFPDNISVNFNISFDKLLFRRLNLSNVKGVIKLRNKQLKGEALLFHAMDGKVNADFLIDGTNPETYLVTCQTNVEKINLNKLFYECENFGQNVVEDKHLKGIASAAIDFACKMNSTMKIDLNSIYANIDIKVEKGELINFSPLLSLSSFIKVSELNHITFSTLSNKIEIRNQTIYIPYMNVQSNAINVSGEGTHAFNNEINYKIKIGLNELLSQKAKKSNIENTEWGFISEDNKGINLFLSMTGTSNNPLIKYDKKGWKAQAKEDIKQEKKLMKNILRNEFGWFRKDTTLKEIEKKEDNYDFVIEWEETKNKDTIIKNDKSKLNKKWMKNLKTNENTKDSSFIEWNEDY